MEERAPTTHSGKPDQQGRDIPGVIAIPPVIYLCFLLAGIEVEFAPVPGRPIEARDDRRPLRPVGGRVRVRDSRARRGVRSGCA